jgi:acetyl esterase/lipase
MRYRASALASLAAVLLVLAPASPRAQAPSPAAVTPPQVDRNVIYGMYSGLALLMDVHRPPRPNGYGIVFVAGSGWQAPMTYGATPIKDSQIGLWGPALVAAGYTVFSVNHRAAPRFHYPGAVHDVQRAVRFIRHRAMHYGIRPDRIGGLGGSSGGHLIALVAARGEEGDPQDPDAVNREPATLQAIVLRAAPLDLPKLMEVPAATALVTSFLEVPHGDTAQPSYKAVWAQASPLSHVSAKTPPALLIHGDADDLIPYAQSVGFERELKAKGVPVELITVPGGRHGADFGFAEPRPGWQNYPALAAAWFDRLLKR